MAATPAYEFALPVTQAALLPNGEKAISIYATYGYSVAGAVRYLSRWFNLEAGTYQIRGLAFDSAEVFVGPTAASLARVAMFPTSQSVTAREFVAAPGLNRIDIVLRAAFEDGYHFVAFSLWKDGVLVYLSDGDDWLFDTVPLADDDVGGDEAAAAAMPVFSVLPNWADGIIERLSYKTDILTSESATEQRRALRLTPRRSFEASFARWRGARQRLDTFFTAVGQGPALVPVWVEQFRPAGGLTEGQTTISFPTGTLAYRDFKAGERILIMDRDPGAYEVATINARGTDSITLVEPGVASDWPAGSRIMPLRVAHVLEAPSLDNRTDRVGTTTVRFEFVDGEDFFTPSWGHCSPLFNWKPNREESVVFDYNRHSILTDNEVGRFAVYDRSQRTRIGQRLSLRLRGRTELARYRRFLAAARGRQVRFWMPTFTEDISITEDIAGGTEFNAVSAGFSEYMRVPQDARVMLAFIFSDGRPPVYRRLVGVGPVIEGDKVVADRYVLDSAAPPMLASAIERISFMQPARFDQDEFEIKHELDDGTYCRATVVTRSAEASEMPPIDCWITSKPYPLDVTEAMQTAMPVIGNGLLFEMLFRDAIETTMPSIGEGTLRDILIEYGDGEPEAIETAMPSIGEGLLRNILLEYGDGEPEAVETTMPSIGDGELEVILITYEDGAPEAIETAMPVIGDGTLA